MKRAAEESGDDDEESNLIDEDIHITDSGVLIEIENPGDSVNMASTDDNLRRQLLAEFAAELLRLQQTTDAEPLTTDAFAPELLRRWAEVTFEPPITPRVSGKPSSPQGTPSRNAQTTPIDSLPTPTSTSDGRSEAADLLRSRIQKMQLNDGRSDITDENRIADFTGEGVPCDYEELRTKKGEAEAVAALLSAELVALRGRHEEEKRRLIKTAKDLRRRNDELEGLIMSQRLGGNSSAGGPMPTNSRSQGRSVSCTQLRDGEEREGEKKFGIRMRALAQRWTSPHPARGSQHPAPAVEERGATRHPLEESTPGSCTSTINTLEDFGNGLGDKETTRDESMKMIAALEEQLRQSEHHRAVLEQRLLIVKESGDAVIQSLNEELADVADDRARSETAMIKELSMLDSQRRTEREEYEKRIQDWIAHDANRKLEVEEYEKRIESLLGTLRMMSADVTDSHMGTKSSSWDGEAEQDMKKDLVHYIELLSNAGKGNGKRGSLIMSINDAFDLEFNANPMVADDMIEYYRSRPELKVSIFLRTFTLV